MAVFSVFQFISLIALSLFSIGLLNVYLSESENECEMTYMYEYPQFVRIQVGENDAFPDYGLYAYSEGRFTERARKMRFDGVPVLFLPGNVGSHKQVRSLASVALRKALPPNRYGFHFDYFTVDFNRELSALYGGVLDRQASFSVRCVSTILGLYRDRRTGPRTVILIGHSMGGTVARLVAAAVEESAVRLIVTLAAPLDAPVVMTDTHLEAAYRRINAHWEKKRDDVASPVLVSVGGGERDLTVPSALTSSVHSQVAALTTSVPGVWLSADHLCIVWCKQLVLVLNRLLFSVIDPQTRQLTEDRSLLVNTSRRFLKIGNEGSDSSETSVEFSPDAEWIEDSRRQYSHRHDKVSRTVYYMVRLMDWTDYETAIFEVVDLDDADWIFGCQAKYVHGQHRICLNGRRLSRFSRRRASKRGKRRTAYLDLRSLRASHPHWTHVLLRVTPTERPVEISVDVHSKETRKVTADLPSLYSPSRRTVVKETKEGALRYEIALPGLVGLHEAYLLYVEPLGVCENRESHASAEMTIPWADGHEYYDFFTETERAPMKIKLTKAKPNWMKNDTRHAAVIVSLDPECRYKISLAVSPYDVLGQISRHCSTALPAHLSAVLLLVLRHWVTETGPERRQGLSFHAALCGEHAKPYYLMVVARLASAVLGWIPSLSGLVGGPSQSSPLLPLAMYLVALGCAHVFGAVLWISLMFSGRVARGLAIRLVSFGRGGGKLWEWVAKEIRNAPGAIGIVLFAVAWASCGAASLILGAAFYFLVLTKMYEDRLEYLVCRAVSAAMRRFRRSDGTERAAGEPSDDPEPTDDEADRGETSSDSLHFHLAAFSVWCLLTLLNVPALIAWARGFGRGRRLEPDPSFWPGVIASTCAVLLWRSDGPRDGGQSPTLGRLLWASAVGCVVVGPAAPHRLGLLLAAALSAVAVRRSGGGREIPDRPGRPEAAGRAERAREVALEE